jgi:hypothetical protein
MSSIVITSMNPFSKLAFQLQCFNTWKAAGFQVRTANVGSEAEALRAAGVSSEDIIILSADETGKALFGRPMPKIKAVLNHARQLSDGSSSVLLVNSDLYPAVRGTGIAAYWGSLGGAVALTREECPLIEAYNYHDQAPYRGGLDAFCIQADTLGPLIEGLNNLAVSERMCFGIPGWDYMMGALITSESIGGSILDSGVLLHESHKTTYTNVDEFTHYLPEMASIAGVGTESPAQAAQDFSVIIGQACEANRPATKLAKTMYFLRFQGAEDPSPPAQDIWHTLAPYTRSNVWQGNYIYIAAFAHKTLQEDVRDFARISSFFTVNPDPQFRFDQVLVSILFSLLCQAAQGPRSLVTQYPQGNLHAKAVQEILDGYPEGSPWHRLDFARLFGAELVEHQIFNPRIYNYLALSCETELEHNLVTEIWTTVRRLANVA